MEQVEVEVIYLTDKEIEDYKLIYRRTKDIKISLEEFIDTNSNQSLLIIRNLGKIYGKLFEDMGEMLQYGIILNKYKEAKKTLNKLKEAEQDIIVLKKYEVSLLIKMFEKAVKEKLIESNLERFIQVYNTFKK